MKKILLVLTGGTIGSSVVNSTIDTNASTQLRLMERLQNSYANIHEFAFYTIQPVELASENLVPRIWERIIRAVEAENLTEFDGVIITHGTDTLAFSAAALSLFWLSAHLPILLVSSNYPLEDNRANGVANFICALEFIRQLQETGVFVPYQNLGQMMHVHLGVRLASSLQLSDHFMGVQNKDYWVFDGDGFTRPHSLRANPQRKSYPLKANFAKQILMVRPYPGLNYDSYHLTGVNAVLHDLYHSGTAAIASDYGNPYSSVRFIARCKRQNITVFLAPAIKSPACYQSTKALLDEGARMIWNMSLEAAYTKLLLAYGNFDDAQMMFDFLAADIAFEHIQAN